MRKDSRFGPVCVLGWGGSGPLELLEPLPSDLDDEPRDCEQPKDDPELATAC